MEFYELMVKAFNDAGWSQNFVSKEFHINRGSLHNFYKGDGAISREDFNKIIYKIPISYSQKTLLTDSFYKNELGTETFNRVMHIKNVLKDIAEYEKSGGREYRSTPLNIENPENATMIYSSQIKMAVDYIFENAQPGKIYTNYPYSFREVDEAVFNQFLKNRSWNIIHMINFQADGEDEENIDSLFRSIRWIERQSTPYYCVSGGKPDDTVPFPCFFAADSYCILFHPKSRKGIMIKSDGIFESICESAEKFLQKASPLASFPRDLFELFNDCSRVSGEQIETTISGNPCISPVINKESIDEVMRDDLPSIEGIKQIALEHYARLLNNCSIKHYTTDKGLRNFVDHGIMIECPGALLKEKCVPVKYRKKFLEMMIKYSDEDLFFIIDSKIFPLPKYLIELGERNIQIYCSFPDAPDEFRYGGNGVVIFTDKRLKQDIELFIQYLKTTQSVYLKHIAKEYLHSIVLLLEKGEK